LLLWIVALRYPFQLAEQGERSLEGRSATSTTDTGTDAVAAA
jgi:hypothetical protein